MWEGRRVVLGVSGGIAAYKSVTLARELSRAGALVDVVMTRGATEFIGPPTFEAVTRRPVRTSLWARDAALDHVTVGQQSDLIIVAPATASLLARAAAGIADDLLTATLLARTAPVLAAPAMNDQMYASDATARNIQALAASGWNFVGPEIGDLAEGPSERAGRMSEPATIMAHAGRIVRNGGPLAGRTVVVTAGPTREAIDPVRVITNRSSGKMGYRLAEEAWLRGAEVTLISGAAAQPHPVGVRVVNVDSTSDMFTAVQQHLRDADVLIMAAAPADFRPASSSVEKLQRNAGAPTLELSATDDILTATLADRPAGLTVVGFALETGDAVAKGTRKLERKKLDMIVINDALEPGAGFDVDTNAVTIVDRNGHTEHVPLRSKARIAAAILDAVECYRA